MSSVFENALRRTLLAEGEEFTDDPVDRGGPTLFGITEATWHEYCRGQVPYPVSRITLDDARDIYFRLYWQRAQLARLLPRQLVYEVFDACVHHGTGRASRLLQQGYNYVRLDGAAALVVDGSIGPMTANAVNGFCERSEYYDALLASIRLERGMFMRGIIDRDPTQRRFVRGWFGRLKGA